MVGEKWIQVGEERAKAFVFMAKLGYSRRICMRAFPAMEQRHWVEGLEGAQRHFGGVPETCHVGNARSLVLRWEGGRTDCAAVRGDKPGALLIPILMRWGSVIWVNCKQWSEWDWAELLAVIIEKQFINAAMVDGER